MPYLLLIVAILTFQPQVSWAQDTAKTAPKLGLPIDCALGRDCWTVNYVDVDPGETEADFTCATKTYDGHQGTDFALRSRLEMDKGVAVLAAAAGKVERVRDGEDDAPKSEAEYQKIHEANRDCGNGVLIDHGAGFKTLYCHMKQGSIIVKSQDSVEKGQILGQAGQSGYAEFPHLHFSVIGDKGYIDPFTGAASDQGCGQAGTPLWDDPLNYEPFAVFDAGFATTAPDFKRLSLGHEPARTLPPTAPGLVFWVGLYHARAGDEITLTITGPDGSIFKERGLTVNTSRKRPTYFYTGLALENDRLMTGTYTGTAIIRRAGTLQHDIQRNVLIE